MICTYLRSSSFNTYSLCPHKYYLDYVLKLDNPAGKAAAKGTIVHKVMEILALETLAKQNQKTEFVDEHLGAFSIGINIEEIIDQAFGYYLTSNEHLDFVEKDRLDCHNWVMKALSYHNGTFDPRKRKIVAVEKEFDLEITEPWAAYNFKIHGEKISGQLAMKGTIDLVTEVDSKTIEAYDWKTGKRTKFPTSVPKELKDFEDDPQLQIYYWALSQLYPEYEHILLTIYYINDGGPFTVVFNKDVLETIAKKIKKKFTSIKNDETPQQKKGWWCKICAHSKNDFESCNRISNEIRLYNIKAVTEQYTHNRGNVWGQYKAPGSE